MQDVLAALPRLAERGLTLYLNTLPRHIGDAELGEVLEQARVLGVPVMLWPLLDPAEGAWCNEDNIEAFWANVFATLDFVDTLDHNVEIMVVNSELGPPKIDLIRQHFAEGAFGELIALIEGNIDRERFVRSAGRVAELVEELKGRGYGAQITTYPYLLDDMEDGDPDIQDAANVVLEGPAWDRLAFTPYSAAYSEDFARSFGPYFVYSYAQMARRRFGDRVDIALGLISPDNPRAYGSPEQLAADVAAAKAAGISRIDLFDLKGMLAEDRFDEWADALLAEPLTPPVEADTQRFHRSFSLMDSALDAYGE